MKNESGQSLLEVLMVAGLMGILMVILVGVSTTSIDRNREAERRTVATRLAQEGAEWLRSERDRVGWLQMNSSMSDGETWCVAEATDEIEDLADNANCTKKVKDQDNDVLSGDYIRKVTSVLDASGDFYEITVEVNWVSNEQAPVTVKTNLYKKDL